MEDSRQRISEVLVEENDVHPSVCESIDTVHFMNACFDMSLTFSCAVDCFLEISLWLFVNYLHCISPDERSNASGIVMSTIST